MFPAGDRKLAANGQPLDRQEGAPPLDRKIARCAHPQRPRTGDIHIAQHDVDAQRMRLSNTAGALPLVEPWDDRYWLERIYAGLVSRYLNLAGHQMRRQDHRRASRRTAGRSEEDVARFVSGCRPATAPHAQTALLVLPLHKVRCPLGRHVEGDDAPPGADGDHQGRQAWGDALVHDGRDLRPPIRKLDVGRASYLMGVLVQANDPQDRFTAGRVGVTSHLARCPGCLRPNRLALHPEVLNPSAAYHLLDKVEHAPFDVLTNDLVRDWGWGVSA